MPCLVLLISLALVRVDCFAQSDGWEKLSEGLYLGKFAPKIKSKICSHEIVILKIDPDFYSLKLLSASEHDRRPRTAKQWCKEFGLVAAINASMYQMVDPLKSTGYMKNYKHFNNAYINPAFGAFLLFNPADSSLTQVQIVDRRLQKNWKVLVEGYNTVVQNYRMISNGKKRGWPQREELYGIAAIGTDRERNVLFILSPSPYSVHDFIHILISLPVHIMNAMYVEGGPEANLYFKIEDKEMLFVGACEADFAKQDNESWHPIPNVIGLVKRPSSPLGHPSEKKGKGSRKGIAQVILSRK